MFCVNNEDKGTLRQNYPPQDKPSGDIFHVRACRLGVGRTKVKGEMGTAEGGELMA